MQQSPPLQQPPESSHTPARKSSVVGSAVNVFGQAWMYITDEAAAVAAEGPDGLDKAAQHHKPMPKPHLHFNVTSQGMFSVLDECCLSQCLLLTVAQLFGKHGASVLGQEQATKTCSSQHEQGGNIFKLMHMLSLAAADRLALYCRWLSDMHK